MNKWNERRQESFITMMEVNMKENEVKINIMDMDLIREKMENDLKEFEQIIQKKKTEASMKESESKIKNMDAEFQSDKMEFNIKDNRIKTDESSIHYVNGQIHQGE